MEPRVIEARVVIANPFIDQPDDPFVELATVERRFGREEALRIALRFSGDVPRTDRWDENVAGRFRSVPDLLADDPFRVGQLDFLAFRLLDQVDEVAGSRPAGFDGAIHAGSGASAGGVECKVFSEEQIRIVEVRECRTLGAGGGAGAIGVIRCLCALRRQRSIAPPSTAPPPPAHRCPFASRPTSGACRGRVPDP